MSTSPTTSLHTGPDPRPLPGEGPHDPAGGAVEPDLIARERDALRRLLTLIDERAREEAHAEESRRTQDARVDAEYAKTRQGLVEKYATLDREARAEDEARRAAIVKAAMEGEQKAKADFASASRQIARDFDRLRDTAKSSYDRAVRDAGSQLEAGNRQADTHHTEELRPLSEARQISESFRDRLDAFAIDYAKLKLDSEPPSPMPESYEKFPEPVNELFDRLARMEPPLKLLEGLLIPKSIKGANEAWAYLVPLLAAAGLAVAMGLDVTGVIGLAVAGLAAGVALRMALVRLAKQQLERLYNPLRQSLADADGLLQFCRAGADARHSAARKKAAARHAEELGRAKEAHAASITTGESIRDEKLREINEVYARANVEVQTNQARALRSAIDAHDARMAEIPAQSERKLAQLDEGYRTLKEQVRAKHSGRWDALAGRWKEGMADVARTLSAVNREVDAIGPAWDAPGWADRALPSAIPPVVRLGSVRVELDALPGGIPADPRLMADVPRSFRLPALRPFPAHANLLIETPPEGRAAASAVLQAGMFRLLTSLPPGMVRFTIVDPIGIGRGFGAFMHLADYDPALVTNQVWTDARQIEERLAELEQHMETVTQKYLRNEYDTIDAYNAVAGEVREPYRILVIADFPSKFDERAAGRLAAIASGGTPCGVLVLMAADTSRPMPPGFTMEQVRPHCSLLAWDGAKLVWDDPDLSKYPLDLDAPPPGEFATREIQKVGAAAKAAKRVEVPFDYIAPAEGSWWTGDTRAGIDVPLGKAGATKKQDLTLGQGTSQHVLVAGRTGSGKSTLMHALITNLALRFSPDEIDLYLIDFKKGVEFKVYATHALPHASVVAIESEREFGLSVLQRLDGELRLRADRFRDAGVQDLNGYRNAPNTPPMPRVLLIVDEFQEFFVEEDKLAQEAALLLDRLVRQGRAFGVHVLLGSQSLGGAFTLARSTLGQMAVRIALQCSEVDSLLILAENNLAAKWLSRPGEAIYNDANGAPEGNHFFQVVWLSDERREDYLKRLHALALERKPALARTPLVFEGDAPADLPANPLLRMLLDQPAWTPSIRSAQAWLGDAVAIKDPTAALFRRQGGNHLLIVGQNDEAAAGVVAAAILGLAAQYPPATNDNARLGAKFYLLDGTPEDEPRSGVLPGLVAGLPHGVKVGGWRDAAGFVAAVAGEIALRQSPEGGDGPEVFLVIHDLARFRDLRRREDDFGFDRRDEASPTDHLDMILKEGPGLGVHLIAWCDTVNNVNRSFSHQQLREFEMRVLFQMSPTDSGGLLDSPAASKLGRNRAYFSSEEQNRLEKFRPYGLPPKEWVHAMAAALTNRPPAAAGDDSKG
ncbi:ESX-1 secretion system protein EccCa1 [Aquisphaera giovannonii]|uniref:ESX-1 secretion system protein EccCa1 n=1 Tax=Aquisphaera giovannonii TaxID=406548 RepID=A0A5B9VYF9_9BACT|nr:FtsK/SpoIIIE domain-containing protein [Aquisphaera giovannonii]QEH32650.1 ESX-1 secretion system protein EccCa1 [Aquisphaera giovannonii]